MKPRRTIDAALSASIIFFFIAVTFDLGLAQQIPQWHKECKNAFKQFQTKPKHKAFAVTNWGSGGVSGIGCGWAWSFPSKAEAEAAAISQCQKSSGPCTVKKSD